MAPLLPDLPAPLPPLLLLPLLLLLAPPSARPALPYTIGVDGTGVGASIKGTGVPATLKAGSEYESDKPDDIADIGVPGMADGPGDWGMAETGGTAF